MFLFCSFGVKGVHVSRENGLRPNQIVAAERLWMSGKDYRFETGISGGASDREQLAMLSETSVKISGHHYGRAEA